MENSDKKSIRKTARVKKATVSAETIESSPTVSSTRTTKVSLEGFNDLISKISETKNEFENLQKEITEVKESWIREQTTHELQLKERNQQEETERKRNQELYDYETMLLRKRAEDEFNDRKMRWEKEFEARKKEIEEEKTELEELRKQVAGFELEKNKLVKEACTVLGKDLTGQFTTERKLREQEHKAEKDILALKITNLTSENSRQSNEIEALKKTLDDSTKQLKEVAVKVIESSSSVKTTPAGETKTP